MCALLALGDGLAVDVDDRWGLVAAVRQLHLALLLDRERARARAVYHEHEAVRVTYLALLDALLDDVDTLHARRLLRRFAEVDRVNGVIASHR